MAPFLNPALDAGLRRLVVAMALLALLLGSGVLPAAPRAWAEGDKEDKVAERDEVDQRLDELEIELEGTNQDLADTYLDLAETELLIPQAQEDLEAAEEELAEAEEENRQVGERLTTAQEEEETLTSEVESGQEEVDTSNDELAETALEAYKGGGPPNPASVYVGSEDPQDAVDRSMNYQLTLASQGTRLEDLRDEQSVNLSSADRLTAVREEIADLKVEAQAAEDRADTAATKAATAKQDLDDLYADQIAQRDSLEAKKAKYKDDQGTLEERSSTLDSEIEEIAAEETSGGSASVGAISGSGFQAPVGGALNSNFGWRVHPIYGTRKLHAGVDFPVACGTPVKATQSGTVKRAYSNSGAGNKIILSHGVKNGVVVTSSYHHLQGFAVSQGQSVQRGQTVGYVGTTGSSTGCHLHFEIHENGNAVNPTNYI